MNTNLSLSIDSSLASLLYARAKERGMAVENYVISMICDDVMPMKKSEGSSLSSRLKQFTTGRVYGADMSEDYKEEIRAMRDEKYL